MKAAGWVLGAIILCLLAAATMIVLLARGLGPQEAAGQEGTIPEATVTPDTPTQSAPPPANLLPPFPEHEEAFSSASAEAGERPAAIPGLGVMDVVGNLGHFPLKGGGGGFACEGPVPGDGEATLWACSVASGEGGVSHEVVVAGDDPATVLWVRATARGVSEEEAAGFLGYVGGLCLARTDDPLDPEAWVRANVASGGQVLARGAEFGVYGTEEERVLQVVATGIP